MSEDQISQSSPKKWYKTPWGILILLVIWPVSLSYYVWKRDIPVWARVLLILAIWVLPFAIIGNSSPEYSKRAIQEAYKKGYEEGKATVSKTNSNPPTLIATSMPIQTPTPSPVPTSKPTQTLKPVSKVITTPTQAPVVSTPQTDRASMLVILKTNASAKWGDNYEMVKYEYDNQVEAYDWVMAQTAYPDIMAKAKQKWGNNYEMVQYEYNNQVEAYKSL